MKDLIKSCDISFVWHFTKLENLSGILHEGLVSREELEERDPLPLFNDNYRFDGQRNAICCSIYHPNYKMFYPLRLQDEDQEWVVLALKPSILWKKDCAFCVENAASNDVTAIPIEDRKGTDAFNKIFDEIDDEHARKKLNLEDNCPTNPQAEVLVFDKIETSYIVGAAFQSKARAEEYSALYPNFQLIYHRALFMPRHDHRFW